MKTLLVLLCVVGCAAAYGVACDVDRCEVQLEPNSGYLLLQPDMQLVALNGETRLVMGRDGNLVLYCSSGKMVWETGTAGNDVSNGLFISFDGNLYIYNDDDEIIWESDSSHPSAGAGPMELVVQNDNNLVLYNSARWPMWSSDTVHQCKDPKKAGCFSDRCVVLADGKDVVLAPGKSITAENGKMTLEMRMDGNLVAHCGDGIPRWKSGTKSSKKKKDGYYRLVIKSTGEMVIVGGKGKKQKWSNNEKGDGNGAILVAQDDDNIVLYSKDGTPLWHTNTWGNC